MRADDHFPICVGGCGSRGKSTVWYQISDNVRFGECLRCYKDRKDRERRVESHSDIVRVAPTGVEWDPPDDDPGDDPTGPSDYPPPPWVV